MAEKIIELEMGDAPAIMGSNDVNLKTLEKFFPQLKIHSRGHTIKVNGENSLMDEFEKIIHKLSDFYGRYNRLDKSDLERIVIEDSPMLNKDNELNSNFIIHGINGNPILARTPNQQKLVKEILTKDLVFALGPAGTGKTYTAVALAVRALKNKLVKKIILTRPAVEAGESLGFLPGDLKDKLDPYLFPLFDALRDMIHHDKLNAFIENGTIQIAPLAYMRGRTLDNAFVILDEAQNATRAQMKMFLTRMGKTATFVITGDTSQIDLPPKQPSGLIQAIHLLKGMKDIGFIQMNETDVIRHELVKQIILKYTEYENKLKEE